MVLEWDGYEHHMAPALSDMAQNVNSQLAHLSPPIRVSLSHYHEEMCITRVILLGKIHCVGFMLGLKIGVQQRAEPDRFCDLKSNCDLNDSMGAFPEMNCRKLSHETDSPWKSSEGSLQ